jgi:hypothetical protein
VRASKITAVDFFNDLSSPYARKRFFWSFLALCIVCIAGIYIERSLLSEGPIRDVIEAVVTQVLAGLLIILAFYAFYMYFIGRTKDHVM